MGEATKSDQQSQRPESEREDPSSELQTWPEPSFLAVAQQIHALLEHPERMSQLAPLELYRLISHIGVHEAGELLEIAHPEQVRDVIDLQVWRRDRIERDELLQWFYALAQLPDAAFSRHWRALDGELGGFLLRSTARIYLAQEDELPHEPTGQFYTTPDGWFVLDLLGDDEAENEQLVALLEALYRDDADDARRLLHNVMWELPTELEEWSLRWRQGRLEDLGFAPHEAALRIYAYLDPDKVRPDEATADQGLRSDPEPVGATGLTILPDDARSFWTRTLARIDGAQERHRLSVALAQVANASLSADGVDPADEERARESMLHLRGRLSMGLEHLCRDDETRGPEVLSRVALMRVARVGHSLVLQRQRRLLPLVRAGRLGRQPGQLDLVDHALREPIEALMQARPQFVARDGRLRPFESARDLAQADIWITQTLTLASIVALDTWPRPWSGSITLSAFFCTDTANRALRREGPLDREALTELWRRAAGDRFDEPLHRAAEQLAAERLARNLAPAERALIAERLDSAAKALRALSPDAFDPRFIDFLLLEGAT